MTPRETPPLELWGGVECTLNRVGDTYFNQLERSGHLTRPGDLDRFAELGIKRLRYPVLWESTAPRGLKEADWSWVDARLARLRALGVKPIAGLVHHGSGPRHTSLTDPTFAAGLADFAGAVAARYPWLDHYTPVNEPLTTARFSGLYGHWYPHGRDEPTFVRALLTQCRAVVLAMKEIRRVNPGAQLVQTEDLGKTTSTPLLAYQADFDNERRWLSFDLLCGRVDKEHPMWRYLLWAGAVEAELEWFLANPCPPDIVGINHYLTSERFLDERLERYPAAAHGGNVKHDYADVSAVRVVPGGLAGPGVLLQEAWERYGLPLAVTEVHLGCTREEQLRWFKEVWDAALSLREGGAQVRAVTAWSLLGAYDWNTLLTESKEHYEAGVFDLRGPRPRPTALAWLLRELASGREPRHPLLAVPGWWRRPHRLLYPPLKETVALPPAAPIVIAGTEGALGHAFTRLCDLRGLPFRAMSRRELDIAEPERVAAVLDRVQPWAVVNAAGYARVDGAEREPERCYRENTRGSSVLAAACAARGVKLVTFSSDLVFDGRKDGPYLESDAPAPLSVYGRSKAAAEAAVLTHLPSALVVRTSAFFGPWDEHNFLTLTLRGLSFGETVVAENDAVMSPTYLPDLVHACLDLLIDGEAGLWHLASPGAVSRLELARLAARFAGVETGGLKGRPGRRLHKATRPKASVLGSERGLLLPPLKQALLYYLHDCQGRWRAPHRPNKPHKQAEPSFS